MSIFSGATTLKTNENISQICSKATTLKIKTKTMLVKSELFDLEEAKYEKNNKNQEIRCLSVTWVYD